MCKRIFSNQTSDTGEVPFYKIGTLGRIPDSYISKELFLEYKSKYRFPNIGETLISCSGTIGRCIQYDGKDAYFQDSNIVWLINDQRVILNDFLFYLIARYDWGFLNTTTIKRLFIKDLNNLIINYPQDQYEQKHIVNLINTLSVKIRNIEDKINVLKKYRKGIIHHLIKKGYLASKIRDLVRVERKTSLASSYGKDIGLYPFFINNDEGIEKYCDEYAFDGQYLIINTGGAASIKFYDGKFSAMSDCLILRPIEHAIGLYYFLVANEKKINMTGFQGTGLKHLDQKWFFNLKVILPNLSDAELNKLNELIESQIENLKKKAQLMKSFKQYLLTNMFI